MAGTNALGGYLVAQKATFAVTAAQAEAAASVLGTIYVPNNAVIVDVILSVDTIIDDGAQATITIRLDLGIHSESVVVSASPDDNRFIDGFSGQATGNIAAAASGNLLEDKVYAYVHDADNYPQTEQAIEITLQAVAATGADGQLTLTVIYFAP